MHAGHTLSDQSFPSDLGHHTAINSFVCGSCEAARASPERRCSIELGITHGAFSTSNHSSSSSSPQILTPDSMLNSDGTATRSNFAGYWITTHQRSLGLVHIQMPHSDTLVSVPYAPLASGMHAIRWYGFRENFLDCRSAQSRLDRNSGRQSEVPR